MKIKRALWAWTTALIVTPHLSESAPSAAPPLPAYDVQSACEGHPIGEKACVSAEYMARGLAAGEWRKTQPAVRVECIRVNRWSSYVLLWECLDAHKDDAKVMGQ